MTKTSISLKKVLKGVLSKESLKNLKAKKINVTGIELDSRKIKAGDIFIAFPGYKLDGRNYIKVAIESGASVVLAEAENIEDYVKDFKDLLDDNQQVIGYENSTIKIVPVPNLADQVSRIAGKFYGSPSKKMSLVGVTGTNGKTSVCYLLAQALEMMQKPTVMLSTLGNGSVTNLQKTENTTSDPVTIQKIAAEFLAKNYHYLCMEVSSHGLAQKRVSGLKYKVAVFTNLSHDHLDFHGDMESYFQAKRALFLKKEVEFAVINADDEYGIRLLNDPEITAKKIAYSRNKKQTINEVDNWVLAENEDFNLNGISADITTPWGTGRVNSSLLGDFNLSNLLAVAGILGALFGDLQKWIIALNAAKPVIGRMQSFSKINKPTLVVDYAHTPDALEKALQTLRHHCNGALWCVFGCGGDRDNSKRAVMGKTAEVNADKVIITDDNPRTENAKKIVEMILEGISNKEISYIPSRKDAIKFALNEAANDDMVLVTGKGHEDYQEIGKEKKLYSDLETVRELMEVRA